MCLPSDALLQLLPSYLGFSYLGHEVSLHGCSSKAQPLLLTLDKGYLLTAVLRDLQRGIAPLGPPAPAQPHSLLKLISTELVMLSNHLILCLCLLLLFLIFPIIKIFSNESVLHTRWTKYWSFSFSPSNEYSGLISCRSD